MTDWDAIWEGAFESVRRLFEGAGVPDDDESAPVLKLVPPVESEDETEGES